MSDALAPARPRGVAVLAAGASFLLLTGLVWAGALSRLDNFAAAHLMPGLDATHTSTSLLRSILPWRDLPSGADRPLGLAAEAITFPAGALLSSLALLLLAAVVARRLGRRAALLALVAFALGNLLELLLKATLDRPAVYGIAHERRIRVLPFDSSYPSGHALRGVFLATVLAMLWPRLRPLLLAWCLLLVVMLELGGFHTPSDIGGGVLLSATLLLALSALLAWRRGVEDEDPAHRGVPAGTGSRRAAAVVSPASGPDSSSGWSLTPRRRSSPGASARSRG
ncbi:MAG: phosphatase PAP2 family protein [Gaiellaceae bacterium]